MDGDTNVALVLKKKGIKIKATKPKWPLKGGDSKKDALEVEILQMNPLIVKGFESQNVTGKDEPPADETLARLRARPAEGTLAAETLAAEEPRQIESTSGLSTIEKGAILVDFQSTPVREEAVPDLPKSNAMAPVQSENRFSVLQEQIVADIDDDVENILIEDINQEKQNVGTENIESVIVTESHVDISSSMLALENAEPIPRTKVWSDPFS
ncbi:OLC1v1030477C1 [Oldenlandia corymbosa var. corymbosa]|uniref:OLC1v1030477C1 n=1 Tax=Oldenlandia corymbosa var. corymbosa TaxID=529605 RepID=A0AAV1CI46_OLDCO|nr:OLC1v1030477C1 [Oldenlandia corymbosa var. corymbosa]